MASPPLLKKLSEKTLSDALVNPETSTPQRWEVQTDQGWMPFAPGVYFSGHAGEEVLFQIGSTRYEAKFFSESSGVQINLSTQKQRQLRQQALSDTIAHPLTTTPQRWEVETDQGWMPFAPGVYFSGYAGEEVPFQMGSTKYKAKFHSESSGVQINLSTHKQRSLRRYNASNERDSESEGSFDGLQMMRSLSTMNSSSVLPSGMDSRSAFASCIPVMPDVMFGIRVVKAELSRSFSSSGKMSPFTVVEMHSSDGTSKEMTRTGRHSNGHLNPIWSHTTDHPYISSNDDDIIEFRVYDAGSISLVKPVFCGSAAIGLGEFLSGAFIPINGRTHSKAGLTALQLHNGSGEVGSIVVQAFIFRDGIAKELEERTVLEADPEKFASACTDIDVSGGTARFYQLVLRGCQASSTQYIGKDLHHARDEILFYEDAAQIKKQPNRGGMGILIEFMLEYAGVLTRDMDEKVVQLLVLENLRDRCSSLRMLDMKIGQQTADAGWQGKSRLAALRASLMDGVTNSSAEGYRLEGFDAPPLTLSSMDPMLDLGELGKMFGQKKVRRFMLQKMRCSEVLMHFLDLNARYASACHDVSNRLSPAEVVEIVLNEVACRLVLLALACRDCPVPQKWVGSSVAIGFDSDCFPCRSQSEDEIRQRVKVNIFDWGRSELNTLEKHMRLSSSERQDRAKFWSFYVGGIDRLAWETSRMYWHRFGNSNTWHTAVIKIFDFDSGLARDGALGQAEIELQVTPEKVVALCNADGSAVVGNASAQPTTVTYSIEHQMYPGSSRLREGWLVRLLRAANLPRCSHLLRSVSPDAYAVLITRGEDGRVFQQQTCVVAKSFSPTWEATLEVPVVAHDDLLSCALGKIPLVVCKPCGWNTSIPISGDMFPSEHASGEQAENGLGRWIAGLDRLSMEIGSHAQGCICMRKADSVAEI